jgi:hypothetical protein
MSLMNSSTMLILADSGADVRAGSYKGNGKTWSIPSPVVCGRRCLNAEECWREGSFLISAARASQVRQ